MKPNVALMILVVLPLLITQCTTPTQPEPNYSIIPAPQKLAPGEGAFLIDEQVLVAVEAGWEEVGQYLAGQIERGTGMTLSKAAGKEVTPGIISILKDESITHPEGYKLAVTPHGIQIKSAKPAGAFYAVQSLLQLFPVEFFRNDKSANVKWQIPAVQIEDAPRFSYRGMHLDVCRHFFPVEAVKRYIDLLAMHKMNRFHWHLTEDQGWRIEIKKYPRLTEIGAFRDETLIGHYSDQPHQFDGKRYGGFYTQEEVREVVAYAQSRFVTVIPEIEMPGHSQAALAAYPELACTEGPFKVLTKWGISEEVYCPTEETFEFLENVLAEVAELFPGPYIHIGGDECPKTRWKESAFCQELIKKEGLKGEYELQSYFIHRMEKYINSLGKSIIGWDEILEGGLAPNATVMSWRGTEGGIAAAKQGHDVIMTPGSHCYFDHYQADSPDEPLAIGGLLPLKKVYHFEPVPEELSEIEARHVLGAQANLWTEYIPTEEKLQYMAYPRACALAEVVWTNKDKRDYPDFVNRLGRHFERLEGMGVNVARHVYDLHVSFQPTGEEVEVKISMEAEGPEIHYTLDGSEPGPESNKYSEPVKVRETCQIRARAFFQGAAVGRGVERSIQMHKAAGKSITLANLPAERYAAGGPGAVINGVLGSNKRYGDSEWLGFEGKDLDATIDLGKPESISQVKLRFFNGQGQWIYLPKKGSILVSDDGKDFKEVIRISKVEGTGKVVTATVNFDSVTARYVKVIANRFGIIPEGNQGSGHEAWLFVDEIIIN